MRGLAAPIPTIGKAAVKGGFLNLLKTIHHVVPEEGRRPMAEVKLGSCMVAEGAWGDKCPPQKLE
jgi:hypothetical protein